MSSASRIGCALSHLALYRHIASTTNETYLILEDDAPFLRQDWVDVWNKEYYPLLPKDTYVSS
jgi:hypothetical protein